MGKKYYADKGIDRDTYFYTVEKVKSYCKQVVDNCDTGMMGTEADDALCFQFGNLLKEIDKWEKLDVTVSAVRVTYKK